jgi:hypothetical protein
MSSKSLLKMGSMCGICTGETKDIKNFEINNGANVSDRLNDSRAKI